MKKAMFKGLAAAALITGTPALAQAPADAVSFVAGDNGGALAVAQAFYGAAGGNMETSVIDINLDGSAEIAVKFLDQCEAAKCDTSILMANEASQWFEMYKSKVEWIQLGEENAETKFKKIIDSDGVAWTWNLGSMFPEPVDFIDFKSKATPLEASDKQASLPEVLVKEPNFLVRYDFDFDGDSSMESVVFIESEMFCNAYKKCPAVVTDSEHNYLGSIFSLEGNIYLIERENGKYDILSKDNDFYAIYDVSKSGVVMKDYKNSFIPSPQK